MRLVHAKVALGKPADARLLLERAVRCLTNGLGADHPLTRKAYAARAALTQEHSI